MAAFLVVGDFVNLDEDAAFFHASKLMVDSGAEHAHGGREAHVGIDERRDVDALASDVVVEPPVVFLEIVAVEERCHFLEVSAGVEWVDGSDKVLMVGEIQVQERQQQVAAVDGIAGVHRHLAE